MWLLFFARAIPPPDGIKQEKDSGFETDSDPLIAQFIEDEHGMALQQGISGCKEVAQRVVAFFVEAEKDPGKFEEADLAALKAGLQSLLHAARAHHHKLPPTQTQR